jgi:hypothetical protein
MRTVNPAVKVVLASGYLDPKIQHSGAWLGGQPDSKADIVDDHQDLVGKLKAEF